MSSKNSKYIQEFKQTIVNLYHSWETYSEIHKGYGISHSALSNLIKQYSEVKIDDGTVLTDKQIKELQKRNIQLEEENLILKLYCWTVCKSQKRFVAYKIKNCLNREYRINISAQRIYRLMKEMRLSKMSTVKPFLSQAQNCLRWAVSQHIKPAFRSVRA